MLALRPPPGPTPSSGKGHVRWLGGEWAGPDARVPRRCLLARWAEADALLEDERRTVAALEATGASVEAAEHEAVARVSDAAGTFALAGDQQLSTGLHPTTTTC
jgi:hypothetical protein